MLRFYLTGVDSSGVIIASPLDGDESNDSSGEAGGVSG